MNHTALTLNGMTTGQLEQLRLQLCLDFFADETTDEGRDDLSTFHSVVTNCIPHSFVLASLFDVEAMCLDIPDHVLEDDPLLGWVTCPCCDGEKWLVHEGNGWTSRLFEDARLQDVYGHLGSSYKQCERCHGEGEVLDPPPSGEQRVFNEHASSLNKIQTEYEKNDLMKSPVSYKDVPTIWPHAA